MAEITAAVVKELREKTGAGMMDCKRALAESAGDLEQAVDWLRKKGPLVALESGADAGALQPLGRELAMHVAAANPTYLDTTSVDPATLERERGILRDRARQAGKSEAIIDKIVEGQLRKFYEENV